jgi:hypothetical protein
MSEQHHIAAQKAIDGLRLSFKNKKAKSAVTKLHPSGQPKPAIQANAICDCCGKEYLQSRLAAIDSGQRLCPDCLYELRQSAAIS